VAPQAGTLSGDSGAFSGGADVLAGKAPGDDVDGATPWPPVEGLHVVPDREGLKASVGLSGQQDAPGVGIKLNSGSGAPSKESPSQDATCPACK
jgi:hypothetical protein